VSDYIVGLTGGIGSGKSTVDRLFVEQGVALVDTDAIAHELTGPGGAAIPALLDVFGPDVVRADGAMDRVAMRQRVFADPSAKAKLEGVLHPLIRQLSLERCRAAAAPYVILSVPLLVESGTYRERCDRIVVVDCPEEIQIERVMARNALSRAEVLSIMAAQASRAQRLAVADDVVLNDGERTKIYPQVLELHREYLRRSAEKVKAGC
jgi:dephospho-CoA kinase